MIRSDRRLRRHRCLTRRAPAVAAAARIANYADGRALTGAAIGISG